MLVVLVDFAWCAIWNGFPRLGHNLNNINIKSSKQGHLLKLKPHVIFASLEIIDILPTLQGEQRLFSLQKRLMQILKNACRDTRGYSNIFYKSLVNQLKRLVVSCNKQLPLRVYICLTRHRFHGEKHILIPAMSSNEQILWRGFNLAFVVIR